MRRQDFQHRRGGGDRFREHEQGERHADQGRGRSYQEGFYGPGISNFGQGQRRYAQQDFGYGGDWDDQGWSNQGAMGYAESGERDEGPGGYGRFGGREEFGGRGQQDFQRAQWGQTRGGQHNIGSGFGGYNQGFSGTQGQWAGGQGDWGGGQPNWGPGSQGQYGRGSAQGGLGRERQGVKGYTRSDERIKDDVCERLYNEGQIEVRDVSVEVSDGKVTLDGTVPDRRMKHQIEDIVDQCIGVREVENHIRVSRAQGETESAGSSGELRGAAGPQGRSRRDQH